MKSDAPTHLFLEKHIDYIKNYTNNTDAYVSNFNV